MRPTTHRLELFINLPGQGRQRALALASITPAELVDAVLQEFRGELEYLSDSVADYRLVRAANHDLSMMGRRSPIRSGTATIWPSKSALARCRRAPGP